MNRNDEHLLWERYFIAHLAVHHSPIFSLVLVLVEVDKLFIKDERDFHS